MVPFEVRKLYALQLLRKPLYNNVMCAKQVLFEAFFQKAVSKIRICLYHVKLRTLYITKIDPDCF